MTHIEHKIKILEGLIKIIGIFVVFSLIWVKFGDGAALIMLVFGWLIRSKWGSFDNSSS